MWDALMGVLDNWWVMGGLIAVLVGLVVLLLVLRNRREDED